MCSWDRSHGTHQIGRARASPCEAHRPCRRQAQHDGEGGGGKYAGPPRTQHNWHVQNGRGYLELTFECAIMASVGEAPATAGGQAEAVTAEARAPETFDLAALSLKDTSECVCSGLILH